MKLIYILATLSLGSAAAEAAPSYHCQGKHDGFTLSLTADGHLAATTDGKAIEASDTMDELAPEDLPPGLKNTRDAWWEEAGAWEDGDTFRTYVLVPRDLASAGASISVKVEEIADDNDASVIPYQCARR